MLNKQKLVIGLVGETGSGKDTVAEYLRDKYNVKLLRFSDPLRDVLKLYFNSFSKEDMQWLAMEFKKRFGKDILSKGLRKKIEKIRNGSPVAVNGIRFFEDYDFIKSFPDAYVIYTTLDSKSRWQRAFKRGEKSDDAASYEKFLELEKSPTEVQIPAIGKKADFKIENTGTKEKLFQKVDEIITKLIKEK